MDAMKVTLTRKNEAFFFEGFGKTGDAIPIDNVSEEGAKGASPMELVLMAVGACNAIDIVYVLQKQRQTITSYSVEIEGQRKQVAGAKPFKSIHVIINLEGEILPEKALRAASLSFEKYCSVSFTLAGSVPVTYGVQLNGEVIK